MKLGYQVKSLNKYYEKYDTLSSKIIKNIQKPSLIPNMIVKGKIYPINLYCTRRYFSKFCSTNNIESRFFECEECTKYKIYCDIQELYPDEVQNITVLSYPNITPNSNYRSKVLLNDSFTTHILISQYLKVNKVKHFLYPKNAFVCGKYGFIYYSIDVNRPKITEKIIKTIIRSLSIYKFSFNSLINNKIFQLPYHSSITTKNGTRIQDENFIDFILPGIIIKKNTKTFELDLSTQRHILKFKYIRISGELDQSINNTINYILIKLGLGIDILNLGVIDSYDDFLSKISGIEIKKFQYF